MGQPQLIAFSKFPEREGPATKGINSPMRIPAAAGTELSDAVLQSASAFESGAGNDIDYDKEICSGGASHRSSVKTGHCSG